MSDLSRTTYINPIPGLFVLLSRLCTHDVGRTRRERIPVYARFIQKLWLYAKAII